MKAIINGRIYDYDQYIEDGYIIFDDTIVEVGKMADYTGHHEVYDAQGKLIIPGLLNGHTHLYSTLFRGAPLQASPGNFMEVLEKIWWYFDSKLDLQAIEASAYLYGRDSLLMGVTSLIDHHASGQISGSLRLIRATLESVGIKGLVCFESSDRYAIEDCILENQDAISHNGYIGMHASLSLSDTSLEKLSKLKGPIHIHVAESQVDQDLCEKAYDCRVIERLDKHELLRPDSILAHCLYINDKEASIIKDKACYLAINPESNLNNAVGLYNFQLIEKYKLNILVGTDGLGSNVAKSWQDFYYIGKTQINHPSGMSLGYVKNQIQESYSYFSRRYQKLIGRLEQNYVSDFMIIDYHAFTPINKDNIFSHILFGVFDALRPYAVFTDGKLRVDQYALVEPKKDYNKTIQALWRRL